NAGTRPAINVGLSVSRVGSAAQLKSMKQVAGRMRLDLAQYRELAAFAQFSSDLDAKTKSQLDRGARVATVLNQPWDKPMAVEDQVAVIYAAINGYLDTFKLEIVPQWEEAVLDYLKTSKPEILNSIKKEAKITDDNEKELKAALQTFTELHSEWKL
ncbi:MAG TPA: F0F1 ATP synthase subunit alpha, partial [Candidatus Saccharimonadia bacterium]|nr:F0F1 ATP synthase subunit alpha [Candidatus Saccharimonadia bacterium]